MVIFGIIVAIIATGALAIKVYFISREYRVVKIAQEYLAQKYNQEMQYMDIFHQYWFYPQFYQIRFTSTTTPIIVFTVSVSENLEISDNLRLFEQSQQSADNYYIKCFEYYMDDYLLPDVKQLWGDEATVAVIDINNSYGASFSISPMLSNEMTVWEMERLISSYHIYIGTSNKLIDESLEADAEQIFEFFQIIKNDGFDPTSFFFKFPVTETETQSVEFEDWQEIVTVNQVIEQLRAEMEDS